MVTALAPDHDGGAALAEAAADAPLEAVVVEEAAAAAAAPVGGATCGASSVLAWLTGCDQKPAS